MIDWRSSADKLDQRVIISALRLQPTQISASSSVQMPMHGEMMGSLSAVGAAAMAFGESPNVTEKLEIMRFSLMRFYLSRQS